MNETNPESKEILVALKNACIGSLKNASEPIIEEVDWHLAKGSFWVIGGLASSGKSDLLATAAGIVRPIKGQLCLFGRDTVELDQEEYLRERLRIGLVFGDGGRLFPNLTVAANVGLAHSYHNDCSFKESEPFVRALLDALGLDSLYNAPAGRLHRTWRQRVALARCLILSPEVLLLDDPVNGLDPRQCAWWVECLQKMSAGTWMEGCKAVTLAVATDNLTLWRPIGTDFAMLKQHRWTALGGAGALENPTDPLLRELLASRLD